MFLMKMKDLQMHTVALCVRVCIYVRMYSYLTLVSFTKYNFCNCHLFRSMLAIQRITMKYWQQRMYKRIRYIEGHDVNDIDHKM
jgi:hypothetical protein